MPYGGTTPAQDRKIEQCVERVLPQMKKRYKDPKVAKSHAIAICKSSVMKNRKIKNVVSLSLRQTCKSYTVEFFDTDEMLTKKLKGFEGVRVYYADNKVAFMEFMKSNWTRKMVKDFLRKYGKKIIEFGAKRDNLESIPVSLQENLSADFKMPYEFPFIALREGTFNGKFYAWDEIKKACQSLDGQDITLDHSQSVRDLVGHIKPGSVWADDEMKTLRGIGIITDDEEVARKIHNKTMKHVSLEIYGENKKGDNGTHKVDLEFIRLSIVLQGACSYPSCGINTEG